MNYLFIFLLLKLIQRPMGKNLVIQTVKNQRLRKYYSAAAPSETVGRAVQPLAESLYIEDYKQNLFSKIRLGLRLINCYSHVYLLHPNNGNLFYAALCNTPDKRFLSTYTRRCYHRLFYFTTSGVLEHRRDTLILQNYLRRTDRSLSWRSQPKYATTPLWKPSTPRPDLAVLSDTLNICISISAGNKS